MSRLIDADALKQTICLDQCDYMKETCDADCELIAYITNAPTIEAEPVKHGRWDSIKGNNGGYYRGCSECKAAMPTDDENDFLAEQDNLYCRRCGAKMDKGEEE